jgi:hypothetical protein
MLPPERDWRSRAGANSQTLAALRAAAAVELPGEYIRLLAWSDGGEGPLPVQPCWFQLYPASETIEIWRSAVYVEFFPGLLVFGGNGGGEAVAFDLRGPAPWPVVYFDMTNIDLAESIRPLAPDFPTFLEIVGADEAPGNEAG